MSAARTSDSHPLRIDFVRSECFAGSIGMTFCPGKVQYDAMSGAWHRDLTKDLRVIADVGIQAVVTLVTGQELNALQVPDLGEQTRSLGMEWYHLPILDGGIPDAAFERQWQTVGPRLHAFLDEKKSVLVHCKGGLGRAGTIAARLLIEAGENATTAIGKVREAREGAIENDRQSDFLHGLERRGGALA
jgi:ADP-ribosyl-[dinitrogen reductase] hydrolase